MIKSAALENFQSHKATVIEFCPGFNVITGPSDAGKSAFLRGVAWIHRNRPSGDDIKNWGAKKSDPVIGEIVLDNGNKEVTITKERIGSTASYSTSELKKPLDVVGRDVPSEIVDLFNLSEYNFQTQHGKYFLLEDSPGAVAKTINEIVGLSIIDSTLKKINSRADAAKKQSELSQKEAERLQKEIDQLQFLDALGKDLQHAEETQAELASCRDRHAKMRSLVSSIYEDQDKLALAKEVMPAKEALLRIRGLQSQIAKLSSRKTQIENIVKEISNNKATVDNEREWLAIKVPFAKINSLKTSLSVAKEKYDHITRILRAASNDAKEAERQLAVASAAREEKRKKIEAFKFCPTCLRPLDKETIKRMVK